MRQLHYTIIVSIMDDDNWMADVNSALVAVVVFTLNRSFYPTTLAVPPVSFLILRPREIQILWSQ